MGSYLDKFLIGFSLKFLCDDFDNNTVVAKKRKTTSLDSNFTNKVVLRFLAPTVLEQLVKIWVGNTCLKQLS